MEAGAVVASASVLARADSQVRKRHASVCWASSPPALHCEAQCQLGHFHRLTFAAALPTAQHSDIQGRCGGGRKRGGLIACWLFDFFLPVAC